MDEYLQKIVDRVYTEVIKQMTQFDAEEEMKSCGSTLSLSTTKQRMASVHEKTDSVTSPVQPGFLLDKVSLARMIDHTLLKPEATKEQILKLCYEAKEYHFATVCVNPCWVKLCAETLQGTDVGVCSVVGFPLGANTSCLKTEESKRAVADGAAEIDMVINIGRLKSNDLAFVRNDIYRVVTAAAPARVKVIIEACLLTDEEKIATCVLAKDASAHFVKTSTGFSKSGATVEDVTLMRKVVGQELGVKAAGGIRDLSTALSMIKAGANRIGASASVSIVSQL